MRIRHHGFIKSRYKLEDATNYLYANGFTPKDSIFGIWEGDEAEATVHYDTKREVYVVTVDFIEDTEADHTTIPA